MKKMDYLNKYERLIIHGKNSIIFVLKDVKKDGKHAYTSHEVDTWRIVATSFNTYCYSSLYSFFLSLIIHFCSLNFL